MEYAVISFQKTEHKFSSGSSDLKLECDVNERNNGGMG
jgi:hypothetical protein